MAKRQATKHRANGSELKAALRRIDDLEEDVRANQRELDVQFKRIAQIQQSIEQLQKSSSRR